MPLLHFFDKIPLTMESKIKAMIRLSSWIIWFGFDCAVGLANGLFCGSRILDVQRTRTGLQSWLRPPAGRGRCAKSD